MKMNLIEENNLETTKSWDEQEIWRILEQVTDPEVPVLSILDLGIVRNVLLDSSIGTGHVEVTITPTYTGCPAMDMIATNIRMELLAGGYESVSIKQVLAPAWTTDWMTEQGKEKLKAYGIAPPNVKQHVCSKELFVADEMVQCPLCNSDRTHLISEFGSTACKSLFQCNDCKETFDYFKCH